jgi:hypothetical protein
MTAMLDVWHVHPKVWRLYESEKLAHLSEKERQYAKALLTEFHNRHAGIPAGLAASLVVPLTTSAPLNRLSSPWKEVRQRLITELASDRKGDAGSGQARIPVGITFSAAPVYVIQRIVLPLVNTACQNLGRCILFSEDEDNSFLFMKKVLDEYETQVSKEICRLADFDNRVKSFDLFWAEHAAALSSYSMAVPLMKERTLPNSDPLASAFVLRIDKLPRNIRDYEHLERIHVRRNRHRSRHLREEGLAGVTQTRSMDMLQQMLISELVNPDPILADRLLNTGYLVNERLPHRERFRDALIIAFMPPEMQIRPAADILRACWLNLAAALYQILVHNHLHDSQIIWIEGEIEGSFTASVVSIDELRFVVSRSSRMEIVHSTAYRKSFLNLIRWLPDYIDRTKEKVLFDLETAGNVTSPADWISRVWRTQFNQKRWLLHPNKSSTQLPQKIEVSVRLNSLAQQFAYVHAMTFLPVEIVPDKERTDLRNCEIASQINRGLYAGDHEGLFQSVNWLNNKSFIQPGNSPVFCDYFGAMQKQQLIWGGPLLPGDLLSASQDLEQVWLDEIIQEMQRE